MAKVAILTFYFPEETREEKGNDFDNSELSSDLKKIIADTTLCSNLKDITIIKV